MTKHDCDVCRGRGKIRIPVYRPLDVHMVDVPALDAMESPYRDYPCPECSEVVPVERIAVVKHEGFAVSHYENDPRFIESVKHGLARALLDEMVTRGLVKFERGPTDDIRMRFAMRLTAGVVAPGTVATLQERVAEHQTALAREVMVEAKRQIDNWGSFYGHADITKMQARDSVDSALRAVLESRARWREIGATGVREAVASQ